MPILTLFLITACGSYKPNDIKYSGPKNGNNTLSTTADADKDGIKDKFDQCPDTPANVTVNSHGCPKDTDGDGVADYKDKELITPTDCQPSDENGVGDCSKK